MLSALEKGDSSLPFPSSFSAFTCSTWLFLLKVDAAPPPTPRGAYLASHFRQLGIPKGADSSSASRQLLRGGQSPAPAAPTVLGPAWPEEAASTQQTPAAQLWKALVWHQVAAHAYLSLSKGNPPLASEPGPTALHAIYFPGGLGTGTDWLRSELCAEIPDLSWP